MKNKRIIKKRVFIIAIFIVSLLFLALPPHFCDFLGMGKLSWTEILNNLWLYCAGAGAITGYIFLSDGINEK